MSAGLRVCDLIEKKKRGDSLTTEEIRDLITGFVRGEVEDYQMSAFAMAVYFQGMSEREMTDFTLAMAASGQQIDLSPIDGCTVDKHSTGGVGDKTTLIIGPIAACCGVKVAKMSGRGLGFTGGTLDKLESIPGLSTNLPVEDFFRIVNEVGFAVAGQTGNLVPADKELYKLRDVTATVDSLPLIASSIMSKKLAAGSGSIVLDVKTGSGAFMKTREEAVALAKAMCAIGRQAGRRMAALITNMDVPLGNAVGNVLEVIEAIEVLKGAGPEDLRELSLVLAAHMISLARQEEYEICYQQAVQALGSGEALKRFTTMVQAQGGDGKYIEYPESFLTAPVEKVILSDKEGYMQKMDTQALGSVASVLGAGRKQKEDSIDPLAGIIVKKKTGDFLHKGEEIARLYTSDANVIREAETMYLNSLQIGSQEPEKQPLVLAQIMPD